MEKSNLTKPIEETPILQYSSEEALYNGKILSRLITAKNSRDTTHKEFSGSTYLEEFKNNESIANTEITRDKTNKDLAIKSGTVEQKLLTILAEINRLNLMGEVRVFDKDNDELQEFGMALTDICDKTAEIEGDEEKKLIRQLELIKQGTVFIQDNWVKRWKKEKTLNKKFDGKIQGIEWETKLQKVFDGPERSVLFGPGVYFGNVKEFETKKQPYIYTVKVSSYSEVESRYGARDNENKNIWERWKYVPKKIVPLLSETNLNTLSGGNGWSLTNIEQDMVEEIHYQDQNNDEYQIYLNGIAMLPVGFPLSAITPNGMFNIEKQVLQVINPFFMYGRSFIAKTQQLSDLLDEMIKLLILKTRKSIHPPYANISGKVISEKSLMPGAISMGIDPGALVKIGEEGQGATSSEYQMLSELKTQLDNVTISPQMQGQGGKSGQTAYEVSLLQQQAQKTISLIIFACSMLEKKVTWIRSNYILANYFEPIGTKVDDTRNELVNVYRTLSKRTTIKDKGVGIRKIIPIENSEGMTEEDIYNEQEYEGTPIPSIGRRKTRTELGMDPLQILYLDINILKNCKYIFFIEVESKPKDTSVNAKLMFREELRDLQGMAQMGAKLNMEEIQNQYAITWNKRKEKLFGKPIENAQMAAQGGGNILSENIPKLEQQLATTQIQ